MSLIDIMPGVKYYKGESANILFGVPPEVIKNLMIMGLDFPDYLVLPDTPYREGTLQNCTEFPLYSFLFVQGNFFKGRKLNILGQFEHVQKNRELLRLTLVGPTKEEYAQIGESKYFDGLYKESRAISVKDQDGEEVPIDDMVNFIGFSEDQIACEHFVLKHEDTNVYSIDGVKVDINFNEKQMPPYDIKSDYVPMRPGKFGMDVLGGASGFIPDKPCSGLLLNYNSDYMLVDCMPYVDYFLSARGVSLESVRSIFLSHIHDDHCNIFPLVLFNNKIKFLGTKEIYWMALQKLSLQTYHDVREFQSYFDFVELKPYQDNDFYGITIRPHYTVHSIPTIGATFKLKDRGQESSICFVGDNKSLPDIEQMTKDGVVAQDKQDSINRLYHDHFDLLFADGGQGILHGDPKDSLESKSDRVIFLHLEKLPKEFDTTFSIAEAGKRYMITEGGDSSYMIKTMAILYQSFPGISQKWLTTLLNNLKIVMFNAGDIIMKQGEVSKGMIYIILTGGISVKYHDGETLKEVTQKEAGDFIGEMAIVKRTERRSASAVARVPVTLCEIPENLFYAFLVDEERIDTMKNMWALRAELEKLHPFSGFSDIVNDKIAKVSNRREFIKGDQVIKENDSDTAFYIIVTGKFAVIRGSETINEIGPGEIFGEYGSLSNRLRNATIEAMEDSAVYEINNHDINQIIATTPVLEFIINHILKERHEDILLDISP